MILQQSDEQETYTNGVGTDYVKYLISGDKNGAVKKWQLYFDSDQLARNIELDTCVDPSDVMFSKPGAHFLTRTKNNLIRT